MKCIYDVSIRVFWQRIRLASVRDNQYHKKVFFTLKYVIPYLVQYCIVQYKFRGKLTKRNNFIARLYYELFSDWHCADNLHLNKSDIFFKVRPSTNKNCKCSPYRENHSVSKVIEPNYEKNSYKEFIREK